jgi:hypothetical protein
VKESIVVTMTENYSASSQMWVVNPSTTSISGNVSANAFGTVTVAGQTAGVTLSTPGVSFSATGSGQVTIASHLSVAFGYQLNGVNRVIWQNQALAMPAKTFNLNAIAIP